MKCSIMLHYIWVFFVCQSTCLGVSQIQRVKIYVWGAYKRSLSESLLRLGTQTKIKCEDTTKYNSKSNLGTTEQKAGHNFTRTKIKLDLYFSNVKIEEQTKFRLKLNISNFASELDNTVILHFRLP